MKASDTTIRTLTSKLKPKTLSPLVVIVGETASGKSRLAIDLAKRFNGEIICADSRTVYKGLDIGTAKPTAAEQRKIKHHLLDIVTPDQPFNVAQFKKLAEEAIRDISSRGRLPIMVGGTGLYVDSVLFDYKFSSKKSERDPLNPRHLKDAPESRNNIRENTLVMGLGIDRENLNKRINIRVANMMKKGLVNEVKNLSKRYGWDAPGLQTIGYKEFKNKLDNKDLLTQLTAEIERNTSLYAKRQRTWFRRNNSIHWVDDPNQFVVLVTTYLNKK